MTKMVVIKKNCALYAIDADNYEIFEKLKDGEETVIEFFTKRNPENHKRYFAFLKVAFEMQDIYTNKGIFRKAIQVKAGHYDLLVTHEGQALYVPLSIAWEQLAEEEFQTMFKECVDAFLDMYNKDRVQPMSDRDFLKILDFK